MDIVIPETYPFNPPKVNIDIAIHVDSLFYLGSTLSYGNGVSLRLDKQRLQDTPASLQVCQENKITN